MQRANTLSCRRRVANTAVLLLLCLSTFVVNNRVLEADIMESRNIVTAREMVYDGHWMVTTMNGELRLEKPPLPTWLAAVAEMASPDDLGAQRLMSALAATMLVLFVYKFSRHVLRIDPWLPTLLLCTCYNVILMGRTASWDIYCHAFMMGAIYFLARALTEPDRQWQRFVLAGAMVGLSIMSKGPVSLYALLLPFLLSFAAVYRPSVKGRGQLVAIAVVVALTVGLWWYAYIYALHPDALSAVGGKEAGSWLNRNVRPWYYYWKFFLETGVWSLLLITAIVAPLSNGLLRKARPYALSLLWTLLTVALLSLLPEKKNRYLLPMLIPASMTMACLLSHWIKAIASGEATRATRVAFRLNAGAIAVCVLLLPIAAYLFIYKSEAMSAAALAVLTVIALGVAAMLFWSARAMRPRIMVVSVVALFVAAECFGLPYIRVLTNNSERHSIALTRDIGAMDALPFYHDSREPLRIELVYSAHRSIRPLQVSCPDTLMSHLPCALLTHGDVCRSLPAEVLRLVDTTRVGTYDDNRRPRGTRRYSGDFIYNVTILSKKQHKDIE